MEQLQTAPFFDNLPDTWMRLAYPSTYSCSVVSRMPTVNQDGWRFLSIINNKIEAKEFFLANIFPSCVTQNSFLSCTDITTVVKSRKSLPFTSPITADFERFLSNLHSHFFLACLLFSPAVCADQVGLVSVVACSIFYSED